MIDEAYDELQELKRMNDRIDLRLEELRELKSRLMSIAPAQKEPVSGGKNKDISDIIAKISERESYVTALIDEYVDKKTYVDKRIAALDDQRYADVLHAYYVMDLTLEKVAERLHYAPSHVRRLHIIAINAYAYKYFSDK